jgi:hypothetical protein
MKLRQAMLCHEEELGDLLVLCFWKLSDADLLAVYDGLVDLAYYLDRN